MKWKIALNKASELVPVNSKVYYLDENGSVLDSSYISKDGDFSFKQLKDGMNYILKPSIAGYDISELRIDLIDERDEVEKIELVNQEKLFIQKDLRITGITERDTPETIKPEVNPGKTIGYEAPKPDAKEEAYTVTFDYNRTQSKEQELFLKDVLRRIKEEIAQNDSCSLSLNASASTVPTSLPGGNYALAERRLKNGKSALFQWFEKEGIDLNKISTKRESAIVSGPDYFTDPSTPKSVFVEYQYFKVVFN